MSDTPASAEMLLKEVNTTMYALDDAQREVVRLARYLERMNIAHQMAVERERGE